MLLDIVGRANDYAFVDTCKDFAYSKLAKDSFVSVVIPHYNAHSLLHACIEALRHQTFDPSRIEIVVADDGSDIVPRAEDMALGFGDVKVVTQDRRGFRISAVRNLGIEAATSPYIIILDCDMCAVPTFVEEHVKVLSVSKKVVSVGFRKDNASADENPSDPIPHADLDWRYHRFLAKDDTWCRFANDQYRIVSGGNLAAHKSLFMEIRFDESFTSWGGEDNEWGYRCINEGMYIYPNLNASARHMRPSTAHTVSEKERQRIREFVERKCPALSAKNLTRDDFDVPYLSVWVTNYNKARFIEAALDSTKGIRYSHEVVVVDDGSTDKSLQILRSLQPQFPHLRILENEHRGAFFAYETALDACKGDLMLQLDADDALIPEAINRMVLKMYQSSEGLVFGSFQRRGETLDDIGDPVRKPTAPSHHEKLLEGMRILCPRLMRRRDFSRTPSRSPRPAAIDYALYSKLHLVASSTQSCELSYLYRQHDDTISQKFRNEQFAEPNRIMDENLALLTGDFEYEVEQVRERLRRYTFTKGTAMYLDHLGILEPDTLLYLKSKLTKIC